MPAARSNAFLVTRIYIYIYIFEKTYPNINYKRIKCAIHIFRLVLQLYPRPGSNCQFPVFVFQLINPLLKRLMRHYSYKRRICQFSKIMYSLNIVQLQGNNNALIFCLTSTKTKTKKQICMH